MYVYANPPTPHTYTQKFVEFKAIYSTTLRSVGNLMFAFLQDSAQGKEVMDEWKSPMLTESGMRSAFDQLDIDHDGHITLEGEKKKKIRNVNVYSSYTRSYTNEHIRVTRDTREVLLWQQICSLGSND